MAEIAHRYSAARPQNEPIETLPPKFLVPYIEQAALEEPDSPLVGLWSNLLISAAEHYDPTYISFSRIIGTLSPRQGEAFQNMFRGDTGELDVTFDEVDIYPYRELNIYNSLESRLGQKEFANYEEIEPVLSEFLNYYAVQVIYGYAVQGGKKP